MKKSLTSLELAALVNELQFLVNGKISQLYHQENEFLFQLHSKEGKQLLRVMPGKFLNLTKTKETSSKPSSLCMQLRKYLSNALIKGIKQKESERIIVLELEKAEKYLLIIELFAPGNLILTDPQYQTIATFRQQKFKDRFIKPRQKYIFPQAQLNWKTINEKRLTETLKKSNKKNLATSLATEIGLGGIYAEEICKLNQINKNKPPQETEDKEIKLMIKTIKKFLDLIKQPKGFIYAEQITPFPLKEEKIIKKTTTYNEAIDTLKPIVIISPYEKKISAWKRIIQEQQEAVKKHQENIKLNTQKAETLYQHYQPLQKLLNIIQTLKQTKSWEEIKSELKKEKKIKKINLKEKKVTLEF